MKGADVYIGVSGGTVPEEIVASMADDAIIFGLANPTPEVHPDVAHRHARVGASSRWHPPPDHQRALLFAGILRGAFRAHPRAHPEGVAFGAAGARAREKTCATPTQFCTSCVA